MTESSLSENEFIVLNYLDIYKLITDISIVQEAIGLESHEIESLLSKLDLKGYVVNSVGTDKYWEITPSGESAASVYRQFILNQVEQKATVLNLFENFENLNVNVKELVTKWQLKSTEGVPVINDHKDAEYDAMVLKELFKTHKDVVEVMRKLTEVFPRYNRYISRLDYAIEKLKNGEHNYIIRDSRSYHSVWHELHDDILKLWGRERVE